MVVAFGRSFGDGVEGIVDVLIKKERLDSKNGRIVGKRVDGLVDDELVGVAAPCDMREAPRG